MGSGDIPTDSGGLTKGVEEPQEGVKAPEIPTTGRDRGNRKKGFQI